MAPNVTVCFFPYFPFQTHHWADFQIQPEQHYYHMLKFLHSFPIKVENTFLTLFRYCIGSEVDILTCFPLEVLHMVEEILETNTTQ